MSTRVLISKDSNKKLQYLKLKLDKGSAGEVIDELIKIYEEKHGKIPI
jgi:hypothetical protein